MLQTATSQQSSKRTALLFTVFYPYLTQPFHGSGVIPNAQGN